MSARSELQDRLILSTLKKVQNAPDYVQKWYNSLVASDESAETIRDYTNKVVQLLYFVNRDNIREVSCDDLTEDQVVAFFISKKYKVIDGEKINTSDSYQISLWHCLNNFFEFLVDRNYIDRNYMSGIKKPKNRDLTRINRERVRVTKEDLNTILEEVEQGTGSHKAKEFQKLTKERDKLIFLLFMTTGMRKTALTEVNLCDIDMDNKLLVLTDKGEKEHAYKLNDLVMEVLDDWLKKRKTLCEPSEKALFISRYGKRMSGTAVADVTKKYSECVSDYGLSPHKFRSAFCSILYDETGDIEFVRRAVGHSNVATTQRYIVTKEREKEVASNIFQNIFAV
jgi:site-specific recombinase XerD